MIKPSAATNYSITVGLFEPLVKNGAYIRTLENELDSYSHVISANGGFISASITINTADYDDWLLNGLGRHIVAYGSGGEIIWEGFVDNISINLGNITIERGRLSEICNRCSVTYTPVIIDPNTGDEESGDTMSTVVLDDDDSIDKYGIWEMIVSGGSISGVGDDAQEQTEYIIDTAEYIRDLYLEDNKEPEISHSPIIGTNQSGVSMTLDCKGYIEWLRYVYNYEPPDTAHLSMEISDKLIDVLAEDPNGIFSTDTDNLQYNGLLINSVESKDRTARTIIDEAVSIGDIDNNRWLFGIYENRVAYYYPASTQIDYFYYTASNMQKVTDFNGSDVLPWNIRPGKIVFLPDTILGGVPSSNIRSDPRAMFLEEISFTAPDTVNLQGKKIKSLDQLQAQLGLA